MQPCTESKESWALVVRAVVATRDSRFGAALEYLELAAEALERAGDDRGLYQALSIKEWAEFWSGDCSASMATSSRALDFAATDAERVHTLLSLSSAALDMRRWDEVETASAKAAELLPRASKEERSRARGLKAHAAFYRGDIRTAQQLIEDCQEADQTSAQQLSTLNTLGMIELSLGAFAKARRRFNTASEAADSYGHAMASSLIEDNLALLDASVGEFASARERLLRLQSHAEELDSALHCSVLTHAGTVMRRGGAIRDSLEPTRRAIGLLLEERDPYLALNARANLAFSEGLLGADRMGQLEQTAADAGRAGVHFVRLKAVLYTAVLAAIADDEQSAVSLLRACLPEQLRLGHVNLVTQELGPRPHIASAGSERSRL